MVPVNGYHSTRFPYDPKRETLWKTLCAAYFQPLIAPDACVLELGAGYGHFINNIRCGRRIAIDQWDGMRQYLQPEIVAGIGSVTDLSSVEEDSLDFVFASNLFEHLTQREFSVILEQLLTRLKPGGTLNILQPNYRYAYREYFDDYTHVTAYSHHTLMDFLAANGFRVILCQARFLPLTIKSRLPAWPALIRLYLALPFKPMGKQMLVRAVPEKRISSLPE
ncbi:MAG: methyltransferase domain-containing protein [Bryobacteraceae bacterium]